MTVFACLPEAARWSLMLTSTFSSKQISTSCTPHSLGDVDVLAVEFVDEVDDVDDDDDDDDDDGGNGYANGDGGGSCRIRSSSSSRSSRGVEGLVGRSVEGCVPHSSERRFGNLTF